jgi:ribosomal protein L7/L12
MSELNKDQVIEFLSNLTVLQISEITKELEAKWGVSAAAAVAVTAFPFGCFRLRYIKAAHVRLNVLQQVLDGLDSLGRRACLKHVA